MISPISVCTNLKMPRGWCPSCTTRSALETAAHLESVLPLVAHRQWTLSLPMSVRFLVVKKPKLLKRLEVRLVRAVRLLPLVTQPPPQPPPAPTPSPPRAKVPAPKPKRPRLDWAQLHQKTFGNDVLLCPCGGRRSIRAVHSTRKQPEARLTELGVALPSRVLPPATAPPQLLLAM